MANSSTETPRSTGPARSGREVYPDLHDRHASREWQEERYRLYVATLALLYRHFDFDNEGVFGKVADDWDPATPARFTVHCKPWELGAKAHGVDLDKLRVLAVIGWLLNRNLSDPTMGRRPTGRPTQGEYWLSFVNAPEESGGERPQDEVVRIAPRFIEALTEAVKHYNSHRELYERVFSVLKEVGAAPADSASTGTVIESIYCAQLTAVVERLAEQRVSPDAPQIRLLIVNAVNQTVSTTSGGTRGAGIDVDLPDLDSELSVEIEADNVRSLSVLYFSAQLEDMRLYAIADQIAFQFQQGELPLSRGGAGDLLYDYLKTTFQRLTEVDRRGLYARSFGFAQGGVDQVTPNAEFNDLWLRALASVSAYSRNRPQDVRTGSGQLINVSVRDRAESVTHMQVFKDLRDLAVNLSLHGYGMSHYAALELQETIKKIRTMLSHADLLAAYGVRDYFQLIERASQMYLSSNVNTLRSRVMAQSGSKIIQWIADHSAILASPRPPRADVLTDATLVDNVEKWISATGTTGDMLHRFSQPVPVAAQQGLPGLRGMRALTAAVEGAATNLDHLMSGMTGAATVRSPNTKPLPEH